MKILKAARGKGPIKCRRGHPELTQIQILRELKNSSPTGPLVRSFYQSGHINQGQSRHIGLGPVSRRSSEFSNPSHGYFPSSGMWHSVTAEYPHGSPTVELGLLC